MPSLESFLKLNSQKIEIIKWLLVPMMVAALFFFLDTRYLNRTEFIAVSSEQKELIMQINTEQKAAINKLTDAITSLAVEQRNTAEYQRNNNIAIVAAADKISKHELSDSLKWDRATADLVKLDSRLDSAEAKLQAHETTIMRNTGFIDKVIVPVVPGRP
jgi:hypothetical protein